MSAILSAFKDVDLRKKILFTIAMIILYRIGAQIPSPGINYASISGRWLTEASFSVAVLRCSNTTATFSTLSCWFCP